VQLLWLDGAPIGAKKLAIVGDRQISVLTHTRQARSLQGAMDAVCRASWSCTPMDRHDIGFD
jgi:hypothetical protein